MNDLIRMTARNVLAHLDAGDITHVIERGLRVRRCVSGGNKHQVPLTWRDIEDEAEMCDHLPARSRPASFQEADVPLRNGCSAGQVELTEASHGAPVAEVVSEGTCCGGVHGADNRRPSQPKRLPQA